LTTADRLELLLVERLVIELQAAVGQLAEAEVEIFVDRPGVDDVVGCSTSSRTSR
jgi:hypothetical protein